MEDAGDREERERESGQSMRAGKKHIGNGLIWQICIGHKRHLA